MNLRSSSPPTSAICDRIDDALCSLSLTGPDKCRICDIFVGEDQVHYCIECGKQCCESCGDFDGMRAYTWSCYNCLPEGCKSCRGYDNLQEDKGDPGTFYCNPCWEEWEQRVGGGSKNLEFFPIGKKFDVLDTSDRWSEAVVISHTTILAAQVPGEEWKGREVLGQHALFKYIFWDDSWNEWIDIGSNRIIKFGTKTYQPDEGGKLQVGQRIEAREAESGSWLTSYVEEINDEAADGKVIKVRYHGQEYEETTSWLPRDSDRIRQYGLKKDIYLERRIYGFL